jgi:hypothetical protein
MLDCNESHIFLTQKYTHLNFRYICAENGDVEVIEQVYFSKAKLICLLYMRITNEQYLKKNADDKILSYEFAKAIIW